MPFDEEESDLSTTSKSSLKNVSSQKSMFENAPKKPSLEEFNKKVNAVQEKATGYKFKAGELALLFNKAMADKTLKQNKTVFANDFEQDILSKMVQLAIEINADPIEQEGMGSLSWIVLLLKTCFSQRDKINSLEYAISSIDKKIESEIAKALDKKTISE